MSGVPRIRGAEPKIRTMEMLLVAGEAFPAYAGLNLRGIILIMQFRNRRSPHTRG